MPGLKALSAEEVLSIIKGKGISRLDPLFSNCKKYKDTLIPDLIKLSTHTDLTVRYNTISVWGELDPNGAIGALLSFIRDVEKTLSDGNAVDIDIGPLYQKKTEAIRILATATHWEVDNDREQAEEILWPIMQQYSHSFRFAEILTIFSVAEIPELSKKLHAFIKQTEGEQYANIVEAMLLTIKDPEVEKMAEQLLLSQDTECSLKLKETSYKAWGLLNAYILARPEPFSPDIISTLIDIMRKIMMHKINDSQFIDILGKLPANLFIHPQHQQVLEEFAGLNDKNLNTHVPLEKLACISPQNAASITIEYIKNNNKDTYAGLILKRVVEILNIQKTSEATEALIEIKTCLTEVQKQHPDLLATTFNRSLFYLDLFVELDLPHKKELEMATPYLMPDRRLKLHCKSNNITAQYIIDGLKQCGILSADATKGINEFQTKWKNNEMSYYAIRELIEANCSFYLTDGEAGEFPVNYARFLTDLEVISNGVFNVSSFCQNWEGEDPKVYRFEISFKSETLAFEIPSSNDWYTPEPFIMQLNSLLKNEGMEERFFSLYTGDQSISFTFARGKQFLDFAQKIHFPINADEKPDRMPKEEYQYLYPLSIDGFSCNYLRLGF
ncbi:MAG: hypothetical protein ACRBBN_07095 [Methyloligellaceae bacterium]